MKREFRNDYIPLNQTFKINSGDKAIVLEVKKPDVKISVKKRAFTISYRDFIVLTRQINFNKITQLPTT